MGDKCILYTFLQYTVLIAYSLLIHYALGEPADLLREIFHLWWHDLAASHAKIIKFDCNR